MTIRNSLCPFGEIEPGLLSEIRAAVEETFELKITLGKSLPIPKDAYSPEREQFLAKALLRKLAESNRDLNSLRLGITKVDLYAAGLNCVFGEASPQNGVGIFSLARLDPRFYGQPARVLAAAGPRFCSRCELLLRNLKSAAA